MQTKRLQQRTKEKVMLLDTRKLAMSRVSHNGLMLEFVSEELKRDRDIVLKAVRNTGYALRYASDELKQDREFVLAAVTQSGCALLHASEELKKDRDIVLAAVTNKGYVLLHASEELKQDREFVLAAVTQSGYALLHASEELKKDRDIVLAAVTNKGYVLCYASEEMKRDLRILATAIATYPAAIEWAEPSVFYSCPLLRAVKKFHENPRYSDEQRRAVFQQSLDHMIRDLDQWSDVAATLMKGSILSANEKQWVEESIVAPLHHPDGLIASNLKRKHDQLLA